MDRFDFIILGAGASAFAAAIKANELGALTAMVRGPLPIGGTCVNVGCVPSKSLVRAAELAHLARTNPARGVRLSLAGVDFAEAIRAERELVGALRQKKYEAVVSELPNVTVLEGTASFTGAKEVRVGTRTLTAERFLVATGSTALPPPIPGLSEAGYLTHITALGSEHLPKSLLILGDGPVGLEFAQIYARFGSTVTLVTPHRRMFPRTEPELSRRLEEVFVEEGITVIKNASATSLSTSIEEHVL